MPRLASSEELIKFLWFLGFMGFEVAMVLQFKGLRFSCFHEFHSLMVSQLSVISEP